MKHTPYNVEICSIGNEITTGKIIDTHSQWLSKKLCSLGFIIKAHHSLTDNRSAIEQYIHRTHQDPSCQKIIITGGLGPTSDDLTVEAVSDYFVKKNLITSKNHEIITQLYSDQSSDHPRISPQQLDDLTKFKINNNRTILTKSKTNLIVIPNDIGTAHGLIFLIDKKPDNTQTIKPRFSQYNIENTQVFCLLPGVKSELHQMFNRYIANFFEKISPNLVTPKITQYLILGLTESQLDKKLKPIEKILKPDNFGIYLTDHGIILSFDSTTTHHNKDKIDSLIKLHLQDHLIEKIPPGSGNIASLIINTFIKKKLTLSVAESVTAGGIMAYLASISGCSQVVKGGAVVYTKEIKNKVLDIDLNLIDQYSTVSCEVSEALAINCAKKFNTDYSIAVSGYAGPIDQNHLNNDSIKKSCDDDGYMCIAIHRSPTKQTSSYANTWNFECRFRKHTKRTTLQRLTVLYALFCLWIVENQSSLVNALKK